MLVNFYKDNGQFMTFTVKELVDALRKLEAYPDFEKDVTHYVVQYPPKRYPYAKKESISKG